MCASSICNIIFLEIRCIHVLDRISLVVSIAFLAVCRGDNPPSAAVIAVAMAVVVSAQAFDDFPLLGSLTLEEQVNPGSLTLTGFVHQGQCCGFRTCNSRHIVRDA
ncbi:unnamed protein product, partial [Closterium sp. NIES-53]